MDAAKHCSRKLLASGDVVRAEYCKCGMVHVSIGAFSIRFEKAAFESMVSTLMNSLSALRYAKAQEIEDMKLFLGMGLKNQDAAKLH